MTWVNFILAFLALSVSFQVCLAAEDNIGLDCCPVASSGVFRNRVYTFHPNWTSIGAAIRTCALKHGAVLASVTDEPEREFIVSLFQKANFTGWYVWVGGFYSYPGFVWEDTDQPIAASMWAAGNPVPDATNHMQCTALVSSNPTGPWILRNWPCHMDAGVLANNAFVCVR